MKVICAGFSRTGTKSVGAALTELGYKVYDYEEHYTYHANDWYKIFNYGWSNEHFERMYKGIDAVVDIPAHYFWKEISDAFPEAKIIFMERDEEIWADSLKLCFDVFAERSIMAYLMTYLSPTATKLDLLVRHGAGVIFGFTPLQHSYWWRRRILMNRQQCIRIYKEHNERVKKLAPPDKLLVLDLKKGWQPLCKFLDKPVPKIPFPHLNKGADSIKEIQNKDIDGKIIKEMLISSSALILLISALAYAKRNALYSLFESVSDAISSQWKNLIKIGE